jgi:DNA-binding PadR family transcriptional regulator
MPVRHALLGLLSQRPRHGYDLHAAFEAMVGGGASWDVKPAQIYATLARLAKDGLVAEEGVEQAGGPEKRIFGITPPGRRALADWLNTGVGREDHKDEFYVKLMLSLLTAEVTPGRVVQAQRGRLYQDLHRLTVQRNQCDPQRELARLLLYDKAIMHLEADLRWLDMVEARLGEVQRQPLPEPEARPRGRPRKTPAAPQAEGDGRPEEGRR